MKILKSLALAACTLTVAFSSYATDLKVGDEAPNFNLQATNGEFYQLSDYKGQYVVLYFYPKDMTPGCTTQACEFTTLYEDFKKKNIAVFGVSVDSKEKHQKFTEKYNLSKLVHYEIFEDIYNAISREKQLKGWSRKKKVELIQKQNPNFKDLTKDL